MAKSNLQKSIVKHAEALAIVARQYYVNEQRYEQIKEDPYLADILANTVSEEKVKKPSTSTIARLQKEAREKGVISFSVDPGCALLGFTDDSLSKNLINSFDLFEASVTDPNLNKNEPDYNKMLQRILANQAANFIAIRANQHIAVAGGQTVMHAVKAISRRPLQKRSVKVTSLCGRLWSNPDFGREGTLPNDADDAAFILAWALGDEMKPQLRRVSQPLYSNDAGQAKAIMTKFCEYKPDGTWRAEEPLTCIVGVGSLDDRSHRFWEILETSNDISQIAYLKDFAEGLRKALKIVNDSKLPKMGDVTNRLFPVLPLPAKFREEKSTIDLTTLSSNYNNLNQALAAINSKRIGVNWSHLQSSKAVTLIAGGQSKQEALFTLLLNTHLNPDCKVVTELHTDSETAKSLIQAATDFKKLGHEIQDWYQKMLLNFFKENQKMEKGSQKK